MPPTSTVPPTAPSAPGAGGDLASALRPLVFRLYYVVRRETPQVPLTLSQGAALATVVARGPLRMGDLAAAEGVRVPSMTDVVARLERAGLVTRVPDPEDGRAVLVEATAAGAALYRDIVAARDTFLRDRLGALPDEDRAAIAGAIPALTRLLAPPTPSTTPDQTEERP